MSIDFLLVDPIYLPGISRYNGTTTGPLVAVNADTSHSLTEVFWVPMLQWVGGLMTPLSCWSLPHHAGYHWSTNVSEINDVADFLSLAFSQDLIEIGTWLLSLLWFVVVCSDSDAFWGGWGHQNSFWIKKLARAPKMIVELAKFD